MRSRIEVGGEENWKDLVNVDVESDGDDKLFLILVTVWEEDV